MQIIFHFNHRNYTQYNLWIKRRDKNRFHIYSMEFICSTVYFVIILNRSCQRKRDVFGSQFFCLKIIRKKKIYMKLTRYPRYYVCSVECYSDFYCDELQYTHNKCTTKCTRFVVRFYYLKF